MCSYCVSCASCAAVKPRMAGDAAFAGATRSAAVKSAAKARPWVMRPNCAPRERPLPASFMALLEQRFSAFRFTRDAQGVGADGRFVRASQRVFRGDFVRNVQFGRMSCRTGRVARPSRPGGSSAEKSTGSPSPSTMNERAPGRRKRALQCGQRRSRRCTKLKNMAMQSYSSRLRSSTASLIASKYGSIEPLMRSRRASPSGRDVIDAARAFRGMIPRSGQEIRALPNAAAADRSCSCSRRSARRRSRRCAASGRSRGRGCS